MAIEVVPRLFKHARLFQAKAPAIPPIDEPNWYWVQVHNTASFLVRAYSEDHAQLKMTYWCHENPQFGINPDDYLPHAVWPNPLGPVDQDVQQRLGSLVPSVRLQTDHRPLPGPEKAIVHEQLVSPAQLALFSLDKWGRIVYPRK